VEIRWLLHARQRYEERGIRETLVRQTVREPEQEFGHGTHRVFQRRYYDATRRKEYLVRVFVEVKQGTILIRSVYRTSKIRKYWRLP